MSLTSEADKHHHKHGKGVKLKNVVTIVHGDGSSEVRKKNDPIRDQQWIDNEFVQTLTEHPRLGRRNSRRPVHPGELMNLDWWDSVCRKSVDLCQLIQLSHREVFPLLVVKIWNDYFYGRKLESYKSGRANLSKRESTCVLDSKLLGWGIKVGKYG